MLELDKTLLIQLALFLFLTFVLNRLMFRPVRAVIARRRERIEGGARTVDELSRAADEMIARHEALKEEIDAEGGRLREQVRLQAREQQRQTVAGAREQAAARLGEVQRQIEARVAGVRSDLAAEAARLSAALVRRVLGRG